MLVVIPSYDRVSMIEWVIKSVLVNNFDSERVKVVIANNYPPNNQQLKIIIQKINVPNGFSLHLIERDQSILHVDNWYTSISEYAEEDETVLLLGDDDLLFKWSLALRYKYLKATGADILICKHFDRVYYNPNDKTCWISSDISNVSAQYDEKCISHGIRLGGPEPSFLSNHTYKYSKSFRDGLSLAYEWCNTHDWLDDRISHGMLPLYLPFAISQVRGVTVSLNQTCVIRGGIVPNVYKEEYAGGAQL